MIRTLLPLLLLVACSGSGVGSSTCESICRELVQTCGYAAYPDLQSCLAGCAYYDQQGADVDGELACIQDATCDTFLIIECENAYGLVE